MAKKAVPTFSATEMQRRLNAIRDHMASNEINAVLFTLAAHIRWAQWHLYRLAEGQLFSCYSRSYKAA
jgi:creatinase